MNRTSACVLCGSETAETRFELVDWIEPVGREAFSAVPRCRDRQACRSRVELVNGEPWPVRDGTPAPPRPATPVEEPPPDDQEVPAWLRA